MPDVYVEPVPKGRPEGAAVLYYVLEYAGGDRVTFGNYATLAEAVTAARALGHRPLVARVRNTSKRNPMHWREA
ncbi:hypothetical protein [Gemmata sp.]|uniref:hypothetical protein n=1 Tax=Gemmata sp. TaxID=1914242 RepID=UPI003F707398